MSFLWFGWDSIHSTEKIHRRLERLSIALLAAVTIFDFLEWKYWNAFWNSHQWLQLGSTIALAVLTTMESIALRYGERKDRLHEIELKKREEKHQSELNQLRIDSAESAMTAHVASAMAEERTPRSLTEEAKESMKARLSIYAGQAFRVLQIDLMDTEAAAFAREIYKFLEDCGWRSADSMFIIQETPDLMMKAGVAVALSDEDIKTPPNPRDLQSPYKPLFSLSLCFIEYGIAMNATPKRSSGFMPIPKGTIEIIVSAKPMRFPVAQSSAAQ